MCDKSQQLQDKFLNALRKDKVVLAIYLASGIKLQGVITSFDQYVVFLKADSGTQMVYKHAISTIVPSKNVDLDLVK